MSARTIVKSIQDIMRQDSGVDGDAQRISQLCWMFFLKIIDDQDQELELLKPDYRSPVPERFQWRSWAADPEGITGEALLDFVNGELFPALKALPISATPGDRRRVVRDVFEDAYNYMKSGQLMRQVINRINGIDFNNLTERQHFGDIYEQILNDLQSAGNAGEYYTPRAVTAFMVDRVDPRPGEVLFDPACGTGGFLTCALRHMRSRYVKKPTDEWMMQNALRAVEKKPLPHMLCVTNMLLHGVEEGQKAYSMTKPIRLEHLQGCIDWWGGPAREGRAEGPQAWRVTADEVKARGYNLDIKNPNTVADDHGDPEALLAELDAAEAEAARLRDALKAILAEALAR